MLLQVRGAVKRFGDGDQAFAALDGVDLDIDAGEFVALFGPSGSGKSTLIHLAAGLDEPDEGSIHLLGRDLADCSKQDRARLRRREVGLVFQFFHLVPALTVAENVGLPLLLDRRRTDGKVDAVLDQVELGDRARHLPSELSGGQMQRAAIARALVSEPTLVLADEPTGNLDSATGRIVMDVLERTVRTAGAGMLLVTHDETVAGRADRVVRLRDGRFDDGTVARRRGDAGGRSRTGRRRHDPLPRWHRGGGADGAGPRRRRTSGRRWWRRLCRRGLGPRRRVRRDPVVRGHLRRDLGRAAGHPVPGLGPRRRRPPAHRHRPDPPVRRGADARAAARCARSTRGGDIARRRPALSRSG